MSTDGGKPLKIFQVIIHMVIIMQVWMDEKQDKHMIICNDNWREYYL